MFDPPPERYKIGNSPLLSSYNTNKYNLGIVFLLFRGLVNVLSNNI